jgi:hypothetical protein
MEPTGTPILWNIEMISLKKQSNWVRIVSKEPGTTSCEGPGIILDHEEAAQLAEELLRWVFTTNPGFRRDKDSITDRLASHMWNNSTIRHGLFSPPQFSQIAELSIRSFFNNLMPVSCPVPTGPDQPMTITCSECGGRINFSRGEVFQRGGHYVCIRHVAFPKGPSAPGDEGQNQNNPNGQEERI